MRSKHPSETQEQAAALQWLALKHPQIAATTFSIPNEGKTSWIEGKRLKSLGMKSGVPDLFIPKLHLFIEMKSKIGKLTKVQKEFHALLRAIGYCVIVCYGIDDFVKTIESAMRY